MLFHTTGLSRIVIAAKVRYDQALAGDLSVSLPVYRKMGRPGLANTLIERGRVSFDSEIEAPGFFGFLVLIFKFTTIEPCYLQGQDNRYACLLVLAHADNGDQPFPS
jgi:hypothetical protein